MFDKFVAVAVDDSQINLILIKEMAKEIGLKVIPFLDPIEALEYVKNSSIDILFIDYMMPEMDGITLIKEIRKYHQDVPIVMITAVAGNEEIKLEALEAGATEFLNKPLNVGEFTIRVKNLSKLREFQLMFRDRAKLLEAEVAEATKNLVQREYETLEVLGKAAEYKDPETKDHIARVAHYCMLLLEAYGEDSEQQNIIYYASPLHDIGKIGTPDSILLKPGRLTKEEFNIMKEHVNIGWRIIKGSKSKYLQAGAIIAKSHHERWDGSGYPDGLKGDNIPLFGRIVAIADVFDALTSKRPYKQPWSFEDALKEIKAQKGRQFDPDIVDLFVANIDKIKEIYDKYQPNKPDLETYDNSKNF